MNINILRAFTRAPIRVKVSISSCIVTFILLAISAIFFARFYFNDKQTYVYELHASNATTVAATIREALVLTILRGGRLLPSEEVSKLDRVPAESEVFLQSINGNSEIVWQDGGGSYRSAAIEKEFFSNAIKLTKSVDIMMVNNAGKIVFQQKSAAINSNYYAHIVRSVMNSQMTVGNTLLSFDGINFAVGFREIHGTNLMVVLTSSMQRVFEPLRHTFTLMLALLIPLFFFGLMAQLWFVGSISRPIKTMIDIFAAITKGDLNTKIVIPADEFRPVFAGAAALQAAVAEREERLRFFSNGLRIVLEFSRQYDVVNDLTKAIDRLVGILGSVGTLHPKFAPIYYNAVDAKSSVRSKSGEWTEVEIDTQILSQYLTHKSLESGGVVKGSREGETSIALVVPIIDASEKMGAIIVPFDEHLPLVEAWDLVPIITKTLADMIMQWRAVATEKHQALVSHELKIARHLQENCISFQTEQLPGVLLDYLYEPAETIGGDWVGVFQHPANGVVNIYVGDVTGHGIGAAFHTSLVSGAVATLEREVDGFVGDNSILDGDASTVEESSASMEFSPRAHFFRVWRQLDALFTESSQGLSMTMVMISMDIRSGVITVLNAGHSAPFVLKGISSTDPARATVAVHPSPQIGTVKSEAAQLHVAELQLVHGQCILAYTDGLDENVDTNPKRLGTREIRANAETYVRNWNSTDDHPASELYRWSLSARDGYEKRDDVAIVVMRFG